MEHLRKLQNYRAFKVEYSDAKTAYCKSVEKIDWFCDIIGINLFRREFNIYTIRFLWGSFCVFVYIYIVSESTYYFRDDAEKVLSCLTTFGFCSQAASKIYSFILRRNRAIEVHEMNLSYFDSWISENETIQKALKPSVLLNNVLLTLTVIGYIVLGQIIGFAPMLYGLVTSTKVLSFGFEIIHSDSWTAYIINGLFQANCCFYVAIVTAVTDGAFVLHLMTATGQIDAIEELLAELDGTMKQLDNEKKINHQLKKIIQLHQHHQQYMGEVSELFSSYFLIAIASLCCNMSISLAAFVLIKWYLGLLIFCFCSTQIFYMCFLGTYMEKNSERLMMAIGSFDWYKLSVSNQKSVNLLILAAQNPNAITAVLQILNMEAYVQIHNTVYSALMMLLTMKE